MPTDDLAVQQLRALAAVPGALRVITAEPDEEGRAALRAEWAEKEDAARAADAEGKKLRAAEPDEMPEDLLLRNPRAFVIHDVTDITGPDERGRYTAHTAEGDMTQGLPGPLLARLQEANRG